MYAIRSYYELMKRIAIPIVKGKLSEHFGQCNHYELFEVDGKVIKSNELTVPINKDVEYLPIWAYEQGITDIITYRVDKRIISLFAANKINLFVGISIESPEFLIESYLNGTQKFTHWMSHHKSTLKMVLNDTVILCFIRKTSSHLFLCIKGLNDA